MLSRNLILLMPNFIHHTFDGGGIAIWHITESAEELRARLASSHYDEQLAKLTHDGRRAEWLAVRLLVAEVLGRDKLIAYHPTGAPYLTDGSYHISISHTRGYAAIAYHRESGLGVDVEYISSRVERIAHRFSHPSEEAYLAAASEDRRPSMLLVNWSAKETLYKLVGDTAAADFSAAFAIRPYALAQQGVLEVSAALPVEALYTVHYAFYPDFVCTWAVKKHIRPTIRIGGRTT